MRPLGLSRKVAGMPTSWYRCPVAPRRIPYGSLNSASSWKYYTFYSTPSGSFTQNLSCLA